MSYPLTYIYTCTSDQCSTDSYRAAALTKDVVLQLSSYQANGNKIEIQMSLIELGEQHVYVSSKLCGMCGCDYVRSAAIQ